ncbi:MAG: methyl-accepting chemotaxis protein [Vicinamibacterales bacterium]
MKRFTTWTIGSQLLVGFLFTAAMSLAVGYSGISSTGTVNAMLNSMYRDNLVPIVDVCNANLYGVYHNRAIYDLVIEPDQQRMKEIVAGMQEQKRLLSEKLDAYRATELTEDERAVLARFDTAWQEYETTSAKTVALALDARNDEAMQLVNGELQERFSAVDGLLTDLVDMNRTFGEEAYAASDVVYSRARTLMLGIVFAAFLIGAGVGLGLRALIGRNLLRITTDLRQGAEQVVAASGQVSTSAQSLSQGATEQAASLEETSASMEEMASMTRRNADNSRQVAVLVGTMDERVNASSVALGRMVQSMEAIQQSSAKVSKIIKTIDEIAFQTNILALNAAVEAARAGEAGMGFAVVADEVRNLAQRSAQAAKDTAELIEESLATAEDGGSQVGQVSEAIRSIVGSVGEVRGLVQEVTEASNQQSQGIGQVSQAVSQMERVTQTTAATAEESAAAAEELNAQAEASMQVVRRLEAMVGAQGAAAPAAAASGRAHEHKLRLAA